MIGVAAVVAVAVACVREGGIDDNPDDTKEDEDTGGGACIIDPQIVSAPTRFTSSRAVNTRGSHMKAAGQSDKGRQTNKSLDGPLLAAVSAGGAE